MIDHRRFERLDGRVIRLRASNCWGVLGGESVLATWAEAGIPALKGAM
jgi:hypothetical protein